MPSIVLLQRDHEASPRLRALIDDTGRFRVVGMVHTADQARQFMRQRMPHILVTDMRVQDGDVRPLLSELKQAGGRAAPHILATLVAPDDAVLLEALRAGADGYWAHTSPSQALVTALEQVWRGGSPISPTIARQLLRHFCPEPGARADGVGATANPLLLSGAELELLQWVARGYLIDEVAARWQASAHSVACHIRNVYHKLQFDRRARSPSLTAI